VDATVSDAVAAAISDKLLAQQDARRGIDQPHVLLASLHA
jgi:hypothetical protein